MQFVLRSWNINLITLLMGAQGRGLQNNDEWIDAILEPKIDNDQCW
jgi:hypothetical protein